MIFPQIRIDLWALGASTFIDFGVSGFNFHRFWRLGEVFFQIWRVLGASGAPRAKIRKPSKPEIRFKHKFRIRSGPFFSQNLIFCIKSGPSKQPHNHKQVFPDSFVILMTLGLWFLIPLPCKNTIFKKIPRQQKTTKRHPKVTPNRGPEAPKWRPKAKKMCFEKHVKKHVRKERPMVSPNAHFPPPPLRCLRGVHFWKHF